jgi:hypothetical protein
MHGCNLHRPIYVARELEYTVRSLKISIFIMRLFRPMHDTPIFVKM